MAATLAGLTDAKQIGRYARSDGPSPAALTELRLRASYEVVRLLTDTYDAKTARARLFGINTRLDQAPVEVLGQATETAELGTVVRAAHQTTTPGRSAGVARSRRRACYTPDVAERTSQHTMIATPRAALRGVVGPAPAPEQNTLPSAALPVVVLLVAAAPLAAARGALPALAVLGVLGAVPYALASRRARAGDRQRLIAWLREYTSAEASPLARLQHGVIAGGARRHGDHEVLRTLGRHDRRSAPSRGAEHIAAVRSPRARQRERRDAGRRGRSGGGGSSGGGDPEPEPEPSDLAARAGSAQAVRGPDRRGRG